MAGHKGVRLNSPDTQTCMVIGCGGPSLYRGLHSRNGRGYCGRHRELAVFSHIKQSAENLATYMEKKTDADNRD